MFKRKKKNSLVEELERKAEVMEYVMLENKKKREEENQVISDIQERKNKFKDKWEPLYHSKLNFMTIEEMQGLGSKCLDTLITYLHSLSRHLVEEELNIEKRTLGMMIGDLSKVMEHISSSVTGGKIVESLLEVVQYLYVYEELQQSYLAVDFYSIKRIFPQGFFLAVEDKGWNIA